jgi:Hydantoinase B/oxoprolinase/Hydantoinase/oxoprolinase N-terminal region
MGIDAGGTMTDTFSVRADGRFVVGKSQSSPDDESFAILESSADALSLWGRQVDEVYPQLVTCVYSGTAMLNPVVQRKGLDVGLIVNKGFEHIHSMGHAIQSYLGYALEERLHLNSHRHDQPLVPLERTRDVTERTDVLGKVVIPLREDEVREAVRDLVEQRSLARRIVVDRGENGDIAAERVQLLARLVAGAALAFGVLVGLQKADHDGLAIRGGLVHARETAKKIAASPIVEQEGELCFTLYNAAGDCILTSTGIIIHVGTMGAAIKYMIENDWESKQSRHRPRRYVHQQRLPDRQRAPLRCCDIVPIFWENRLIGWVGGVTHVIDTGAVTPGSMSAGQVQRFGDGYIVTCRKTGVNDKPLRDWLHESQRSVRTPKYWILDERTRIAGCHVVRQMVEEVIAAEGIEAYVKFAFEVIEEGRRGLQSRIKAMTLPGKYRKVAFVDVPFAHEDVLRLRQDRHHHAFAGRDHHPPRRHLETRFRRRQPLGLA